MSLSFSGKSTSVVPYDLYLLGTYSWLYDCTYLTSARKKAIKSRSVFSCTFFFYSRLKVREYWDPRRWSRQYSDCCICWGPELRCQGPTQKARHGDKCLYPQHREDKDKRIPGLTNQPACLNCWAPGSLRNLVSKKKVEINEGRHLTLTCGLHLPHHTYTHK